MNTDRASTLPEIPNDSAHPLRPAAMKWIPNGHIDAAAWYGDVCRDEFHRCKRIDRIPRRGRPFGKPREGERQVTEPETVYVFDDDPETEHDYDGFLAVVVARHGEAFHPERIEEHPLIQAWRRGEEIPYTPSEPAFPVGTTVQRSYCELPEEQRQRFLERPRRKGTVLRGNALYLAIDWGGAHGQKWEAAWRLEEAPE